MISASMIFFRTTFVTYFDLSRWMRSTKMVYIRVRSQCSYFETWRKNEQKSSPHVPCYITKPRFACAICGNFRLSQSSRNKVVCCFLLYIFRLDMKNEISWYGTALKVWYKRKKTFSKNILHRLCTFKFIQDWKMRKQKQAIRFRPHDIDTNIDYVVVFHH